MTELQDIIHKATATKDVVMKDVSNVSDDAIKTKKKKKAIPATIKRLVWNTNIGEMIGKSKCLCCNSTDITQMSFNCGHIVAEANGGDTIVSNLKPICQNCNSSMGTKNMEEFMKSLK
jgi:5-methylcytosine-specific restriction endonuclease McrA